MGIARTRALGIILVPLIVLNVIGVSANFSKDFFYVWGQRKSYIYDHGNSLQLLLDEDTGTHIQSRKQFQFGSFEMHVKLVPNNSAGTVTAFYLSSSGDKQDEIDFEFLGNLTGEPYVLHTNLFVQGVGNREKQFYLWFDPRADFHNYTVLWTPTQIVWFVDSIPVRIFHNYSSVGIPYPSQPMAVCCSLWNGDYWATRGGQVKLDWQAAPFLARLTNYTSRACPWQGPSSTDHCSTPSDANWWTKPSFQNLTQAQLARLKWVRDKYMIYNYCTDKYKFHGNIPLECSKDPFV